MTRRRQRRRGKRRRVLLGWMDDDDDGTGGGTAGGGDGAEDVEEEEAPTQRRDPPYVCPSVVLAASAEDGSRRHPHAPARHQRKEEGLVRDGGGDGRAAGVVHASPLGPNVPRFGKAPALLSPPHASQCQRHAPLTHAAPLTQGEADMRDPADPDGIVGRDMSLDFGDGPGLGLHHGEVLSFGTEVCTVAPPPLLLYFPLFSREQLRGLDGRLVCAWWHGQYIIVLIV